MVQLTHFQHDDANAAIHSLESGGHQTDPGPASSLSTSLPPPPPPSHPSTTYDASTNKHGNSTINGDDDEAAAALPLSVRFNRELRRRILHTTPSWFAINMGTGITAILLHQLPYQFDGLQAIANVIFAINAVLFAIILALSIARYTIWPSMFWTMLYHPSQSLFLGTFPMGFTTLINMTVYSLVPPTGSGGAWLTAAHALWWIDSALALLIAIGIPFVQFTRHAQTFDNINGTWFLPIVTTVVSAATGGTVASSLLEHGHVDAARTVMVASYILWGTGVPLSLMLMTLYYARLAIYKIPPAAMIVSAFLPLGPCGQGAFGLLQLANDVVDLTATTGQFALAGGAAGISGDAANLVAHAVRGGSTIVALAIWGLGLVWLILALSTIADMTLASIVPFNMGWWGYTFPLGTFATASTALGHTMDSKTFLILGTVLSVVVALLWLGLFVVTTWKAVTGTMFFSPCLAGVGGEPPSFVPPARKYAYNPRPSSSPPPPPSSLQNGNASQSLSSSLASLPLVALGEERGRRRGR